MKAQINRLEALIKKIQEMSNKDLEEIKSRQSAINNTITEFFFLGLQNIPQRHLRALTEDFNHSFKNQIALVLENRYFS